MAMGIQNNLFIAQTADALESITGSVFDGVCTANAAKALASSKLYSAPTQWTPSNMFLFHAAGQYLDVFGFLPTWAPGYSEWLTSSK